MPEEDDDFRSHFLNRDRGFLTEGNREYLIGEKQTENEGTERTWKHRIRSRTREALIDFTFLRHLSREDSAWVLGALLDEREDVEWTIDETLVQNGIQQLLRFLYGNLGGERFTELLTFAVQEEYMRQQLAEGVYAEPEEVKLIVEPNEDPTPLSELHEQYEKGEDLVSYNQLKALLYTGYLSKDEFEAAIDENPDS